MRNTSSAIPALAFLLASLVAPAGRAEEDTDSEVARRHFEAGSALYAIGSYTEAASEFEAARRVRPSPALDYNLGRARDRAEQLEEAAIAYERYVAAAPAAEDAGAVADRARLLRRRLELRAPLAAPPPAHKIAVVTRPAPRRPLLAAGLATAGLGAAALAGALAAGLVAHARFGELAGVCDADGACPESAAGALEDGRQAGQVADALLAAGVACVAAGVVLVVVHYAIHRGVRR